MIRRAIIGAVTALMPVSASSQTLDLYFTEPVGGVYVQDWYGHVIGPDRTSDVPVFLRGDGKSGDFYGV